MRRAWRLGMVAIVVAVAALLEEGDLRSFGPLSRLELGVHGMQVADTPHAGACRACGPCASACPESAITLGRAGVRR